MKKVDFDDYVDEYDELSDKNVKFFAADANYFARYKIMLIKKYLTMEPKYILEYGAGVGKNLPFLLEFFPNSEVWACDISEKSVQKIEERYPNVKIYRIDSENNYPAVKFDLIFIAGVYHHIDPALRHNVTQDINHLMRKGGELYIFEHNPFNPVTRRLVDRCPYDEDAVLLKPAELKGLLMDAGFNVEKIIYYLFFPPFFRLGILENLLKLLPLGGQYFIKATCP